MKCLYMYMWYTTGISIQRFGFCATWREKMYLYYTELKTKQIDLADNVLINKNQDKYSLWLY